MQRIEPRQIDPTPAANAYGQDGQEGSQNRPGSSSLPTGFASTGRDAHTQSFEEIYGVPENFLEIEVRSPRRRCIFRGLGRREKQMLT